MTQPDKPQERVSDERLREISEDGWEATVQSAELIATELIEQRASAKRERDEAYADVLRMIDSRLHAIGNQAGDFYRGAFNNLQSLEKQIEQRRRELAEGGGANGN